MLHYYDTKISGSYCGFFAPYTFKPVCTYYTFVAFGELYALNNQADCVINDCQKGTYALASTNGDKKAILLTNHSEDDQKVTLDADGDFDVYLIDQDNFLTKLDINAKDFVIGKNQVVFIKNY